MADFDIREAPDWSVWVTDFDSARTDFADEYANFLSLQNSIPLDLSDEYNNTLAQANRANQLIEELSSVRNAVSSWLSSIGESTIIAGQYGGLSGFRPEGATLGAAPILLYVAGAVAALYVIVEAVQNMITVSDKIAFVNSGHSVAEANALFGAGAPGIGGAISNLINLPWLPLALIAATIILIPRFVGERE